MWKRVMVAVVATGLILAACGSDAGEPPGGSASGRSCPPPPIALSTPPEVPAGFPLPPELTVTSSEEAGPSTILEGYWEADLVDVFEAYRTAFETAGYDVPFSEREQEDAEVNFADGESTGQVRLGKECEGRTDVRITIRPA